MSEGLRTVDVEVDLGGCSTAISLEEGLRNRLRVRRPRLLHVDPRNMGCDHDAAVLVPAPWTGGRHPLAGIVHAIAFLEDHSEHAMLVVGHTSASGSDGHNQKLSEQRADGVRCLLEDDADAWVKLATEAGSLRDVTAYLDYLGSKRGWACQPAAIEPEGSAETKAAVASFQEQFSQDFGESISVDGICGKQTLRAIFRVVRDELSRWLNKLGLSEDRLPTERISYGGCGSQYAGRTIEGIERAEGEQGDRFVDLILFERKLVGENSPKPSEFYESGICLELPLALPEERDAWASGPLTIVTDLTPDEPAPAECYQLRAEPGSMLFERNVPEDAVLEAGELVLRFESLPTDRRYTLTVRSGDGETSTIFEQLPYGALHQESAL